MNGRIWDFSVRHVSSNTAKERRIHTSDLGPDLLGVPEGGRSVHGYPSRTRGSRRDRPVGSFDRLTAFHT